MPWSPVCVRLGTKWTRSSWGRIGWHLSGLRHHPGAGRDPVLTKDSKPDQCVFVEGWTPACAGVTLQRPDIMQQTTPPVQNNTSFTLFRG